MSPRILSTAYALPEKIRKNDDPIFDWLKQNDPAGVDLFTGYDKRHVLSGDETISTFATASAQSALDQAGLVASDIDLLIGYTSVSPYQTPNELCKIHQSLKLDERVWIVPFNNEFSNFNAALMFGDAMIRAKRAKNVLISIAGNWTQFVDYHTPQAISAADGAAAAVLGLSSTNSKWEVIDYTVITDTKFYGSMEMKATPVCLPLPVQGHDVLMTPQTFQISSEGFTGFNEFGKDKTPETVIQLMKRHDLKGADITLISHQASSVLMDAWKSAIQPAQYINTIAELGNMTLANVPVTLAWSDDEQPVEKDNLVFLSVGTEMQASALLLRRSNGN